MSFAEQQYRAHIERRRRLGQNAPASGSLATPTLDPTAMQAPGLPLPAEPFPPAQARMIQALQREVAQLSAWVKAIVREDQSSPVEGPRLIKPVISAVAKYYDVSLNDLVSRRRTRNVVWARHVAMYLVKELTEHSLPAIGRAFDRDHTSVLHACRQIAALRLKDVNLQADIRALTCLLSAPIVTLPVDRRDGAEHE